MMKWYDFYGYGMWKKILETEIDNDPRIGGFL